MQPASDHRGAVDWNFVEAARHHHAQQHTRTTARQPSTPGHAPGPQLLDTDTERDDRRARDAHWSANVKRARSQHGPH